MPEKMPNWFEKFGYGDFIWLEHHKPCCAKMMKGDKFFREIDSNCWEPKDRIIDMDKTDVDVQVLSTIPVLFNYWAKPQHGNDTARFLNDHIAQCVELHPNRFMGLGTLPMQDIDMAVSEMERVVKDLKLPGIEIGSNINQVNLNDPRFYPIWEKAQELDCSIFVHPWEMMGSEHVERYWLPWLVGMPAETSRAISSLIFGGVFEKFPNVKFAFAHGGGEFPATIGRLQHGFDVRPDLCAIDNDKSPRHYLGHFWVDSLVHDRDSFDLLVKVIGEDKICCGSDYPFPLGEHHPGKLIEQLAVNDAQKELFLSANALEWLGIK